MWTIDPQIPISLWWALLAAGIAAIIFYATRSDWSVSSLRRVLLTGLMVLGLAGPLAIALNPTYVKTIPPVAGQPMLTVLIDGTQSMKTEDCGPSGITTRWNEAIQLADQVKPGTGNVMVRKLVLGDQVEGWSDGEPLNVGDWPRGHRTDLAMALRGATRSGSPAGHAVLLISDGAHNVGSTDGVLRAAAEANALATPIHTVTLGTSLGMKNLSLTAKSARMIAFPDSPVVIKANVSQSGLTGQTTEIGLMVDDQIIQRQSLRLTDDANQSVAFELEQGVEQPLQRYRIIASEVNGEATAADNQTTVLVQRLNSPVSVLLLEGKPYWDSKFLARNLARDQIVDLTTVVQLSPERFLMRRASVSDEGVVDGESTVDGDRWSVEKNLASPLNSMELLDQYRVVILGRDADAYLTEAGVENLRLWISETGGCLVCSRGSPTDQVVAKLAEVLPVRWVDSEETRFRTKLSMHGYDSSVFDSLLGDGVDPLATLPSLASTAVPKTRLGLPQVLVEGLSGGAGAKADGQAVPVVTYQPYGRGQTVVVEGAGMWRWAFLPPQFAGKDPIYPTLWQAMIQWIVSQQDLMPGQEIAIRPDRANFLGGDRATASVTVLDPARWYQKTDAMGSLDRMDLAVLLQSTDQELPQRISLIASGMEPSLYRVDLGELGVGYYSLSVVTGEKDEVLAATAFEVRDPWFESLEVDARPDLMRQVARLSGGESLPGEQVTGLIDRFAERLRQNQKQETIKTSMWDRPLVLLAVLAGWILTWVVRRRSGLI